MQIGKKVGERESFWKSKREQLKRSKRERRTRHGLVCGWVSERGHVRKWGLRAFAVAFYWKKPNLLDFCSIKTRKVGRLLKSSIVSSTCQNRWQLDIYARKRNSPNISIQIIVRHGFLLLWANGSLPSIHSDCRRSHKCKIPEKCRVTKPWKKELQIPNNIEFFSVSFIKSSDFFYRFVSLLL